jgi:hypothetical protein
MSWELAFASLALSATAGLAVWVLKRLPAAIKQLRHELRR